MPNPFVVKSLAEHCGLCIDIDGRKKQSGPFFDVTCEGGYSGPICPGHIAALIKLHTEKTEKKEPVRPATPAPQPIRQPDGNGQPAAPR